MPRSSSPSRGPATGWPRNDPGRGPRGVIVAVIYNGLQLPGLGAAAQNMWTAAVLLAAVTVDTVARRSRPAT